ncbi:MAG: hypothetical protein ACOX9R_07635 [Armatimonadota bacterium]|jgi:hypothetical protein
MRCSLPSLCLAIIALLIMAGCSGTETDSAPGQQLESAYLHQQAPGDAPTIRLHFQQPTVPLRDQIFAWLFYRSAEQRYFSLTANYLVDAVFEARLPGGTWDDASRAHGFVQMDREFTWISPGGELETGSISLEFDHPALQPGVRYYHRARRVVEPPSRAGSGAPIAQGLNPAQVAAINVDPWNALSEGSQPTAGVTYLVPAVLQSPGDGALNQSTASITFTWSATTGANEYVLQVFPSDDPDGQRSPRYQMTLRQDFAGTMSHTFVDTFAAGSRFYWRVGARRTGEAQPVNQMLLQRGWLHSSMRSFTTAQAPPSPPAN